MVATVAVEVADPGEECREDIKLPVHSLLLKTYKIYSSLRRAINLGPGDKQWVKSNPVTERKGGNMNIYVGNLPLELTEDELRQEFMAFGEVTSVIVMNDKYIGSGQPRGYGFVEMALKPEGEAAITSLTGKRLGDRLINVVEALPLSDTKDKGFLQSRRLSRFSGRGRKRRY